MESNSLATLTSYSCKKNAFITRYFKTVLPHNDQRNAIGGTLLARSATNDVAQGDRFALMIHDLFGSSSKSNIFLVLS